MGLFEQSPTTRRLLGGMCIAIGLVVNRWTLEATIVADGSIASPWLKLAIAVFQAVLITTGILLWLNLFNRAVANLTEFLRVFYLEDRPGSQTRLPGERFVAAALVCVALLVVVVRSVQLDDTFPDDTYITFRFAEHLAQGEGLVWNLGEERTEGFTSPLHVGLLALAQLAGVSTAVASHWFSAGALLVIVTVFLWVIRGIFGRIPVEAAVLLFYYLVTEHLTVHLNSGLDTMLFMAVIACSFAASLRLLSRPNWTNALVLAGVNFFALLGRPDAAPFLVGQGLVLIAIGIVRWRTDKSPSLLTKGVGAFSLLGAVGALYLAWKFSYYGYILPNSFYVKASAPETFAGFGHVRKFLEHVWSRYLFLALPFLVLSSPRRLWTALRSPGAWPRIALLVLPTTLFLLFYTTTLHAVCFDFRFEYPMVFFICLALAVALAIGAPVGRLFVWAAPRWKPRLAWVALVAATVALPGWLLLHEGNGDRVTIRGMQDLHYEPVAGALRRSGAGSTGTVVFDSAGYIPYASGFSHIDPIGLTDNTLSGREPISAFEREDYIWGRHPDVYLGPVPPASPGVESAAAEPLVDSLYVRKVLLDRAPFAEYRRIFDRLSPREQEEVLHVRMRELRDNWVCVGEVPDPYPSPAEYTHFVYVRRDSPNAAALIRELETITFRDLENIDFENPLESSTARPADDEDGS